MNPVKIWILPTFLAIAALGDAPSGQIQYQFASPKIWDISGDYQRTANGSIITATLFQHADGKVTGNRAEIYNYDGDYAEGYGAISGRTVNSRSGLNFALKSKGTIAGTFNGQSVIANFRESLKALLLPNSGSLQVESKAKVCVAGGRCATVYDAFNLNLASMQDGSWSLALDVTTLGKIVSGTATLTLSNGRSFNYTVKGSYRSSDGRSVLRLKGLADAEKSRFLLRLQEGVSTPTLVRGRILGQRVKIPE